MGVIDGHDVRALRRALRAAFEAERPVVVHVRDRQGQGLRARRGRRPRGHGEVARRQAEVDRQRACRRRAKPRRRKPPRRRSTRRCSARRWCASASATRACRHHRRDELRHRALDPPEGDARALLRRRHRRAAGGAVRRRPGAAGHAARWRRSTRPSCSAPTTRSSTTSACRTLPVTFCMDRAGLVGDDGPTHHGVVRHRLPALRCRT